MYTRSVFCTLQLLSVIITRHVLRSLCECVPKVALEKQRQEYERQFQQLRNILSPSTPYSPYVPYDPLRGSQSGKLPACTPTTQMRVEKWAQERDEMFKRSLGQLKTDILKANALVQEANFLAEEMGKQTKFSVTLQIPPNNLSPNRKVK